MILVWGKGLFRFYYLSLRLCEVQMAAKNYFYYFWLCRFLAIVLPLRHMSWCRGGYLTVRRVLFICLLVWGLAAFAAYTRDQQFTLSLPFLKAMCKVLYNKIFFLTSFYPHSFISVFFVI
jgi:hypothetical protein